MNVSLSKRIRVRTAHVLAPVCFLIATPTREAVELGFGVALLGEILRSWAAGYLNKNRTYAVGGPYRFTRHPLYAGSVLIALGFVIATKSALVSALVAGYLGFVLLPVISRESTHLDEWLREGPQTGTRLFSWDYYCTNREYRAVAGLVLAFVLLYLKALYLGDS